MYKNACRVVARKLTISDKFYLNMYMYQNHENLYHIHIHYLNPLTISPSKVVLLLYLLLMDALQIYVPVTAGNLISISTVRIVRFVGRFWFAEQFRSL